MQKAVTSVHISWDFCFKKPGPLLLILCGHCCFTKFSVGNQLVYLIITQLALIMGSVYFIVKTGIGAISKERAEWPKKNCVQLWSDRKAADRQKTPNNHKQVKETT